MSTSATNLPNLRRGSSLYLVCSVFCFIFSMVYERYSHEVYSPYMVFAVGFPLIGGLLVTELLGSLPKKYQPNRLAANLYNAGIATFTVGSLLQGTLDIYGTTNPMMIYYWSAGFLLTGTAILVWINVCLLRHVGARRQIGG